MSFVKRVFTRIWDNKNPKKWLKWLALFFWSLIILFTISFFIYLYILSNSDLPSFAELENPKYDLASIVYSDNGEPFGKYYIENREPVDYEDLSPNVIRALLSTEDIRFYDHSGIDLFALSRVFFKTIVLGQTSSGGGSTISQQLAKLLFNRESLGQGSKFSRIVKLANIKFKEWITAVRLEKQYTKEEIMSMYLNKFEFINGAHGIQAASQVYFSKNQNELNISEAAMLVGMLKNPSRYNPVRFTKETEERRNTVLKRMESSEIISTILYDSLVQIPLDMSSFNRKTHADGPAPYFRSELTKWLKNIFSQKANLKPDGSKYDIYRDGLKIYTTINLRLQELAETAVASHMATNQKNYWRVWKNKNPITYELNETTPEDSLLIEIRKESINKRVRSLDQYKSLYRSHFSELSNESEEKFDIALKEPTIRKLINKDEYLSQIPSEVRPNFSNLIRSKLWKQVVTKWKTFDQDVQRTLAEVSDRRVFAYNEEGFEIKEMSLLDSLMYQMRILQSGLLSVDPRNGEIKAWVGGVNFENFKYDHVNFRRQVGSTIKPFVYVTAIGVQGLSPCHEYDDIQYTIAPGDANFIVSEEWSPSNSNNLFTGNKYNLYQGLLYSKNSITVKIVKELGTVQPIRDLLNNVGISSTEKYLNGRLLIPNVPSICLGSIDLSLQEITGAYTSFANNGVYSKPFFVDRIEDKNGKIIYQSSITQNVAINPFYNAVMLDMLRNNTGGGRGLGIKSQSGGKTGTTNDYADAWFMGVSPTLVTGVWVGGDEKWIKFYTLDDGQGFVLARPIFQKYMQAVEKDTSGVYDHSIRFSDQTEAIRDFIDCARYKQGEPEDEYQQRINEEDLYDEFEEIEFDEDEFIEDEFDEEIIDSLRNNQ